MIVMKSTCAMASAAVLLLTGLPEAEDATGGKVTDNLYEISKPHLKDPLHWPSIWSPTPQPAFRPGFATRLSSASTAGREGAARTAPARPVQPDWRQRDERRTLAYLRRVGPLLPEAIEALPPLEAPAPAAAAGPVKRYLSQAISLTAPLLADASSGAYFPGECDLRYSSSNESEILQLFDEVVLEAGEAEGVKPGALYRTYEVGEAYRTYGSGRSLGRLIEPNGIVEVIRVGRKSSVARLVKCFGTISKHTRACPFSAPPEVAATSYRVATDGKLAAQVVWVTAQQQFPQPYSNAIVDRGGGKGYRLGDMVLFFNRSSGKMTDKVLGNGIVVHVGDKASTILIRDLFPGIINRGDYAVIVQSPVL